MTSELKKFFKGFDYAIEGIKTGAKERNFKFHICAALVVVSASIFFNISAIEWAIVIFLIAAVMSVELLNSSIESICNILAEKLKLDYYDTWDPRNLAAGAVLIVASAAFIIGLIIFLPKVLYLLL
jgi:undecaprenol kinase